MARQREIWRWYEFSSMGTGEGMLYSLLQMWKVLI